MHVLGVLKSENENRVIKQVLVDFHNVLWFPNINTALPGTTLQILLQINHHGY
jgi:hypothetical protein